MLTDIDLLSLEYICLNMREIDRVEAFAILPHDNPCRLSWEAHHHILNNGRGKIAWHNGKPAAMAAFTENWTGCWQVWAFGTDDFKAAAIPLLRWFRKEANDILTVCKGHRLQCDSRVGHPEAHKMIVAMGGVPEGEPMRRYGKDGSDYQRYIWLNGEHDAVLKPGFIRAA
jgi:hypothetical protein